MNVDDPYGKNEMKMYGGDVEQFSSISKSASKVMPTYDQPPGNVSKSQKDMNRFYQTANNLYGKDKGLNKFV